MTLNDLDVLTHSPRDKYLLRGWPGRLLRGAWREGGKCARDVVNGRVRVKILPPRRGRRTRRSTTWHRRRRWPRCAGLAACGLAIRIQHVQDPLPAMLFLLKISEIGPPSRNGCPPPFITSENGLRGWSIFNSLYKDNTNRLWCYREPLLLLKFRETHWWDRLWLTENGLWRIYHFLQNAALCAHSSTWTIFLFLCQLLHQIRSDNRFIQVDKPQP